MFEPIGGTNTRMERIRCGGMYKAMNAIRLPCHRISTVSARTILVCIVVFTSFSEIRARSLYLLGYSTLEFGSTLFRTTEVTGADGTDYEADEIIPNSRNISLHMTYGSPVGKIIHGMISGQVVFIRSKLRLMSEDYDERTSIMVPLLAGLRFYDSHETRSSTRLYWGIGAGLCGAYQPRIGRGDYTLSSSHIGFAPCGRLEAGMLVRIFSNILLTGGCSFHLSTDFPREIGGLNGWNGFDFSIGGGYVYGTGWYGEPATLPRW